MPIKEIGRKDQDERGLIFHDTFIRLSIHLTIPNGLLPSQVIWMAERWLFHILLFTLDNFRDDFAFRTVTEKQPPAWLCHGGVGSRRMWGHPGTSGGGNSRLNQEAERRCQVRDTPPTSRPSRPLAAVHCRYCCASLPIGEEAATCLR